MAQIVHFFKGDGSAIINEARLVRLFRGPLLEILGDEDFSQGVDRVDA